MESPVFQQVLLESDLFIVTIFQIARLSVGNPIAAMQKTLLFISPVTPDPEGTGLSIRSHNFIKALSRAYAIHLLVVPENLRRPASRPAKPDCCESIDRIGVWHPSAIPAIFRHLLFRAGIPGCRLYPTTSAALRYATAGRIRKLQRTIAGRTYQAVHIFRLRMVPFGLWIKAEHPETKLYLDLDDIESLVHERIAILQATQGRRDSAMFHLKEAENYRTLERQWLPCFDKVYVCSENDRRTVRETYRLDRVQVVPNVVAIRPPAPPRAGAAGPFVFLFLGSFGYFPNNDGVSFFVHEILPIMREKMRKSFQLLLAGPNMPHCVRRSIAKIPEIRYLGRVPSVEDAYRQSDAAIIPLRVGGGTRIKALEAFSFSVPVISTRLGLEGLDVLHDKHVLIADSADEFAAHCRRMAQESCLRERLAANAYQLVRDKYSLAVCEQCLSTMAGQI